MALTILGKIFGAFAQTVQFPGSAIAAPQLYDVDAPVQPVWDLHREGELGRYTFSSFAPGFFQVGQDNVHAAGGTISTNVPVYTVTDAQFGPNSQERVWCWLMWLSGAVNNGGVVGSANTQNLLVNVAALGSALAARSFQVAFFNFANANSPSPADLARQLANVNYGGPAGGTEAYLDPVQVKLPMLIPSGGSLQWNTNAAAAGTIRISTIMWVGPIGVMPPGLS